MRHALNCILRANDLSLDELEAAPSLGVLELALAKDLKTKLEAAQRSAIEFSKIFP